jgi:hypothetical protein
VCYQPTRYNNCSIDQQQLTQMRSNQPNSNTFKQTLKPLKCRNGMVLSGKPKGLNHTQPQFYLTYLQNSEVPLSTPANTQVYDRRWFRWINPQFLLPIVIYQNLTWRKPVEVEDYIPQHQTLDHKFHHPFVRGRAEVESEFVPIFIYVMTALHTPLQSIYGA